MTTLPSTSITQSTMRRLILAKQLYSHGLDHSQSPGALNKMIAVHNFHNAVEITLRAIVIENAIPPDSLRHDNFATLLSQIDKYSKDTYGKALPYRMDLDRLNRNRNDVQHHAIEPVDAIMEEFRVMTSSFLTRSFQLYFSVDFSAVSFVDLIDHPQLRQCLLWARAGLETGDNARCIGLAKVIFSLAKDSVQRFLPTARSAFIRHSMAFNRPSSFSEPPGHGHDELARSLMRVMEEDAGYLDRRIDDSLEYTTLLASGVTLHDYTHFMAIEPQAHVYGDAIMVDLFEGQTVDPEVASWTFNFVVNTLVHWQSIGLVPEVPNWWRDGIQKFIDAGGPIKFPEPQPGRKPSTTDE